MADPLRDESQASRIAKCRTIAWKALSGHPQLPQFLTELSRPVISENDLIDIENRLGGRVTIS